MKLKDKIAVVTGAGRGLGRSAALRLASLGAAIVLIARSEAQLRETADLITAAGGRAVPLPLDLTRELSPDRLRGAVESALGPPAILVNAAGLFGPLSLVRDSDSQAWIEALMVNTVAPYVTCRAFVGGMIDAGWGRIINVSSAATLLAPSPVDSAYGTSKAALNQFTRHLAAEIEGTGVTANVIHPGDVKTDMWTDISAKAERLGPEAAAYKNWAGWVETTGGDDPEKAADLIERIVSEESTAINGQFLWIENGLRQPLVSW